MKNEVKKQFSSYIKLHLYNLHKDTNPELTG